MTDLPDFLREPLAPDLSGNPDQAADHLRLATENGVPRELVEADPVPYQQAAEERRATNQMRGLSALPAWLSDPDNAAIASDDIDSLSTLEGIGNGLRRGAIRLKGLPAAVTLNDSVTMARVIGRSRDEIRDMLLSPDQQQALRDQGRWTELAALEQRVNELEARASDRDVAEVTERGAQAALTIGRVAREAEEVQSGDAARAFRENVWTPKTEGAEGLQEGFEAAISALIEDPAGGIAFLAEVFAESAPALVASAATTAVTRSPAVGISVMSGTSLGLEMQSGVVEFVSEQGIDLSDPTQAMAAMLNHDLMAEAQRRGVAKGLVVAAFDALSGGIAGKALVDSAVGDIVTQGIVQASLGASGEGLGEFAASGEVNGAEILLEGLIELAGTPIEVGGVAGRNFLQRTRGASQAGGTAERLQEIDALISESKLRERMPAKFAEFIDQTGLAEADLSVNADDLNTFFQGSVPADALGIGAEAFDEALASGGRVQIPASVYAKQISGTDMAQWFHDNAVLSEDEMSLSEAERFNREWSDAMMEARAEAEAQELADLEARDGDIQVRDAIFGQLRAAGRSPDVADREAQVWGAFFRTMGERYGEDPLDLARQFGLRIEGPQAPEQRLRGNMDIALNTLRKKGAPKPKADRMSLVDFVISGGGISDIEGEFADMPEGFYTPEPEDNMFGASGDPQAADEVARRAREAGFFPDVTDDADMREVLLDALDKEISGVAPALHVDDLQDTSGDQRLRDLADELDRRGLDVGALTNDEIVAALMQEGPDGETLFQVAPEVGTTAFDAWAGDGHVVVEPEAVNEFDFRGSGPFVMRAFHGTTHEFDAFDASVKGTKEGHFGAVNYFSTSEADADANYAGEGPDLTGRIETQAERLVDEIQDVIDDEGIDAAREFWNITDDEWSEDTMDVARAIARRSLSGGDQKLLEVYVRSEKPFVVGGDKSPFIEFRDMEVLERDAIERVADSEGVTVEEIEAGRDEFEDQIDEARWEIESETPSKLFDAVETVAVDNDLDAQELFSAVADLDTEGADHSILEAQMRGAEEFQYVEDAETGDIISSHVIAQVIKELGFDSIILKNAEQQFSTMDIEPGTAHIQVFDEFNTNIKSVHNRGTFDPEDPRILYQADAEFADYHAAKAEADRLLDEVSKGGDIEKAFEAFSATGEKRDALARAIAAAAGGIELSNNNGLFAAVTKSQNPEYEWRVTYFNESGFLGHTEYNSKLGAVQSALDEGYTTEDVGALRRAMKERSFFQKYKQQARGSITFPAGGIENGETVIKLFEDADLSTLLHESGHFFLEGFRTLAERGDAPEGMVADLKAINAFLGHSEGAYSVDAQEKWARGFEAYLMEGKAPSLALADAFSRFKAWLTRIYKTALGLNVKLTPEIREVMGRMLATDQEIAAARDEQAMRPLFSDAKVAGMSDAEFRPYQRMAQRAAEEASAKLLKKTMDRVRREREAWYKEEKEAVREEVEASVNARREYRLIEALSNRKNALTGEDFPDMRIDRKALTGRFSVGVLPELSRAKFGERNTSRALYTSPGEEGADPDVVAEIFGFRDADEMIPVLQNTVKRSTYIASEVERIMTERHGDPLADGSIEEEALAAIHTEQQAQTVATEARQLAKRIGKDHRNINAKIFRQRARAMIGRMEVRQAVRPAGFLQAERQSARSAQKAFSDIAAGRGDPEEKLAAAQRFKEQQLLNQYLYMEARDLEAEVKRGREKMRAYDKKSVRAKLDGDYIEQIDGILSDYEFRVTSQRQIERNQSLADYVDQMIEAGREAELAVDQRLIDNARKVHYSRLSVDELRGLFDTIANIDHMGRYKQTLRDRQRQRILDESVNRVVGRIRNTAGGGRADRNKGVAAKARSALNLLWSVDTIAMEYDNWQEFGDFYDEVKSGIDKASAEEQRMAVELADKMEGLFSVYSAKELSQMQQKKSIDGANGRSWSKLEIISAALNTGNEDNLQRLLSEDAYESRRLTPEQLDALLDTLDKRDWDFVQSMWDTIDSYWPKLAEVEERRTGVKPQKVDARPVYTKFGMKRGGYYPIKYDADLPGATVRDEESAFDRFMSAGRGSRAAVKNGMTKARQATGGGRTLQFDLQVPFAHLRDTIRLITLSETVDATYRILNDDRVRDALIDAGRADDRKLLNLWLKDVAEGPIFNSDFGNSLARMIKNNFTLSRLAGNLKTIALQLTGLGQAAATVGKKNMLKGMLAYGKDMSGTAADVTARSAFMAERQSTFQKDLYDFANDVKISSPIASRYSKGVGFISKLGFWPIQKLQFYAVDLPTWLGAYQAELAKGTAEETAVQRADRLVARSQASGMMGDRAAVERGTLSESTRQSDMVKIWTTLGSYMLAKMNRGRVEIERAARDISDDGMSIGEKTASALDAASNLLLLYVFEAVVMGLAYSVATDDDDEDAFARYVMAESASSVVAGIPFVKEAVGGIKGFDTGGVLGATFGIAGNIIEQIEQGDNDKGMRRAVGDAVGVSTGLPTTQSLRVIEGILDDDTPLFDAMFGRNPLED